MNSFTATAQDVFDIEDSCAAIEFLERCGDPQAVMAMYRDMLREQYWTHKNLFRAVVFAQAGIHQGLRYAAAVEAEQPELAFTLRSEAKALAFDLASFTWPGWNEPGVELSDVYLAFGMDAANINLRLAAELHKSELALSRAHWMVGAHQLAAGAPGAAQLSFQTAAAAAERAGAADEATLARGYALLARVVGGEGGGMAWRLRDVLLADLAAHEEGAAMAEQLQTAWHVFAGIGE